jgi:hypothetical protein
MLTTHTKSGLGRSDDRVLMYSALFLVCAMISALGAGALGALAFLPAAVIIEAVSRFGVRWRQGFSCQSHG